MRWQRLQQQAQVLLENNYVPPQRYGTAFHLTPPVTDVRQLPLKFSLAKQADVPAEFQPILDIVPLDDPYLLWQLAHLEHQPHQLLYVEPSTSQELTLTGEGIFWIVVGKGAEAQIIDAISDSPFVIRRLFIFQEEESRVTVTGLRSTISFLTERCQVFLRGQGAQITMNHLIYGQRGEQNDLEVAVYHQAPHTRSMMQVRAAALEQHLTMYRGLINIAEHAKGSEGYQQGRGLVLGKRAIIDMLPKLAIKTNDVRCSHGVTTTHLDDAVLFYARSRGLSEASAKQLAIHGFYHHHLPIPEVLSRPLEKLYA